MYLFCFDLLINVELVLDFRSICRYWNGNGIIFSVMAAAAVANIVKSSLGPVGLDKMMVDDVGVS